MNNEFQNIAKQASSLAGKNSKTDWDKVAINLFLIPATLGAVSIDIEDTNHLENTAMPDSWCDSVSEIPNVSKRGLEILTKDLATKGFVSIEAANRFVSVEKTVLADRGKKEELSTKLNNEGAAKLLARAERELPGSIQSFIDATKEFGSAASGVAQFAIEKTVWMGKGLGVVASVLKDVRKA